MYSRFWAEDDVVLRQSGPEPVKEKGKNQQYTVHIHMQHISMFTLTMVSRCLRHLIEYRIKNVWTHGFEPEMTVSLVQVARNL